MRVSQKEVDSSQWLHVFDTNRNGRLGFNSRYNSSLFVVQMVISQSHQGLGITYTYKPTVNNVWII